MDDDIRQLKAELRQIRILVEDTNHIVRSMRRAGRWRSLVVFLWWIVIIATSSYAYYYYLAPQLSRIEALYAQATGTPQPPSFGTAVQSFFKNLAPKP